MAKQDEIITEPASDSDYARVEELANHLSDELLKIVHPGENPQIVITACMDFAAILIGLLPQKIRSQVTDQAVVYLNAAILRETVAGRVH